MARSVFSEKENPKTENGGGPTRSSDIKNGITKVIQDTRHIIGRNCPLVDLILSGDSDPDTLRISILRSLLRTVVYLVNLV